MGCSQDPDLHLSKGRRIFIYFLGITDNLLFGAAVFGWPQLVYTLKTLNVYSNLCPNIENNLEFSNLTISAVDDGSQVDTITNRCQSFANNNSFSLSGEMQGNHSLPNCPAQDERFALITSIAILCSGTPAFAVGYLLHWAGLRTARILGGLLVASSFLCLAASTAETPNWLFPATALLGFGGSFFRMCGIQFGDLFPKKRSTALTFLTGSPSLSSSLFLIFTLMAEADVPISSVSYFFAAFTGISVFFSFLMPNHHIPYEGETESSEKMEIDFPESKTSLPFKRSLLTLSLFLHIYWLFITNIAINVFQQSYNVWITDSSCNMKEIRSYTVWFSYSNLVSVFMAPLGGYFTDCLVKKARKSSLCRIEFSVKEIQANFLPLLVTTLFCLVMYGCFFFHHPIAIVVSLVCVIVVRPCLVAISTAYLRIRFPSEHVTRLIGISFTVICVLQFLLIPHFIFARQMYYLTHTVTFLFLALSLLNPLHLLWNSYMRKEVMERDNLEDTINNNEIVKKDCSRNIDSESCELNPNKYVN